MQFITASGLLYSQDKIMIWFHHTTVSKEHVAPKSETCFKVMCIPRSYDSVFDLCASFDKNIIKANKNWSMNGWFLSNLNIILRVTEVAKSLVKGAEEALISKCQVSKPFF